MERIIFVTGTDTGVGKTLLTCSLLHFLRTQRVNALAMKPFCTGGRRDVELIQAVQDHALTTEQVNPFYFPEPVAPLVAARRHHRSIRLPAALEGIYQVARLCECLIVEGAGGVLVPLGEDFLVADVIARLPCEVVVVARNQLGTVNHTLLTVRVLKDLGKKRIKVLLMGQKRDDLSAKTNLQLLRRLLAPVTILSMEFLGSNSLQIGALRRNCKKTKKVLAHVLD